MKKLFATMMSMMLAFTLICVPVQAAEAAPVMWDEILQVEAPDLSDSIWYFTGACIEGVELTQEEYDASLAEFGGVLNFVFDAEGNAVMQRGEDMLIGAYGYLEEEDSVIVAFEDGEELLTYACVFTVTETNEIVLLAFPAEDETLDNCIYFKNLADVAVQ